ncbi:MAG: hypothetical protein IT304_09145 [Dehalococcoidia bacterium]|nr:hypothetical protein [Dehalococcoidia bacterium]
MEQRVKAVLLAIVLGVTASVGLAGAATASAGAPGDAGGFWSWLVANSPAEEPANCCSYGPNVSCDRPATPNGCYPTQPFFFGE